MLHEALQANAKISHGWQRIRGMETRFKREMREERLPAFLRGYRTISAARTSRDTRFKRSCI